jgi:NADH-quinone oxidoreductase subunit E
MTTPNIDKNIDLLSQPIREEIDHWIAKYPPGQKQSAVLSALTIVQEANGGHLTEPLMNAVAAYLGMPIIAVCEVASFYSMFKLKPVGRHQINVCTNISCQLSGSKKIVSHLKEKLNISLGETTQDGRFTLNQVECLAACTNAPMMLIDKTYYEQLTPEKVDKILEELT